ncbi:hypothetical protein FACS189425_03580 [Clostridia bacterium]|nr:hypothetical protein FACS189425_03580 [Clostridia bacterium]
MDFLSVKEVAELKGCSERNIRKLIKDGKLAAEVVPGVTPKTYRVPVSALPQSLKRKYYGKRQLELAPLEPMGDASRRAIDSYTDSEREQIAFWSAMVREWRESNETAEKFVRSKKLEGLDLSVGTLYRKEKSLRDGDMDSLTDKRGQATRGSSGVTDKLWDGFLSYYMNESRPSVQMCQKLTRIWAEQTHPELLDGFPSYKQFWSRLKKIDKASMIYRREGAKSYNDCCAPYIDRDYEGLRSNEYWFGDNHTLDIISRTFIGSPKHRLYLTAYTDALSGAFMGINISMHPDSNSTVYTLGQAIRFGGAPDYLYQDNGSEYTTHDIGRGHRKRKKQRDDIPPTILELLGIKVVSALPANAKAKTIERTFGTVIKQFSKWWDTYCGSSVTDKPERLKTVLEDSANVPSDSEVIQALENYIFGYFNHQPYTGKVKKFRGMTRVEVFQSNLAEQRRIPEDVLRLLLMRHSRLQKIGRRGVHIEIGGQRVDYFNEALLSMQSDRKEDRVWVAYDPKDITNALIYDKNNRYIMTVPMDATCKQKYGADITSLKEAKREIGALNRAAKVRANSYGNLAPEERISALALLAIEESKHPERDPIYGNVIIPFRPNSDMLPAAEQDDTCIVDIDPERYNRNAERRNELKEANMA